MRQSIRTAILLLAAIFPLRAQELFEPGTGRSPRWASFENSKSEKGGAGRQNKTAKGHAFDSLQAGQSITLMKYNGSGVIRRIWITISDRSPEMVRSLTLAAYWDDQTQPAVLAPLGGFLRNCPRSTLRLRERLALEPGRPFLQLPHSDAVSAFGAGRPEQRFQEKRVEPLLRRGF